MRSRQGRLEDLVLWMYFMLWALDLNIFEPVRSEGRPVRSEGQVQKK